MFHTLSFKNIFFIGKIMLSLFLSRLSDALKERHFLHYKFTALTRADTFPEFSAEVVYDDRRISHYSDEERVWIGTEDWTEVPGEPSDRKDWYMHQIRTLSNCTDSQCSELHVLQRIIGCELEKLPDGSVDLTVFDEYGFDGEDLISFNSDTMQWIEKSPKAKRTKEQWDSQTGRNHVIKHFLVNCTDWISTFTNTKKMGNCAERETEDQWYIITVATTIAVLVLTGIGYCIYLKQCLNGTLNRNIVPHIRPY